MTKHIALTGTAKTKKAQARGRMPAEKVVLADGQSFTPSKVVVSGGKKASGISRHVVLREGKGDRTWTLVSLLGIDDAVEGLNNTLQGYLTVSRIIREGLPLSVMENLKDAGVDTSYRNMIVPLRTLQHRATKGETLSPIESERAYRVAHIMALAGQVFGNHDKGLQWLRKPLKALDKKSPLDVLDNEPGARMVEDLLGRLDEGYFA